MTRGLIFNQLPRENVDPIAGTTNFRGISCTRHDTIIRINWGAWSVNCVVAILNNISQRSKLTLKQGIGLQHSWRRENKPTIRIGRTDITTKKRAYLSIFNTCILIACRGAEFEAQFNGHIPDTGVGCSTKRAG